MTDGEMILALALAAVLVQGMIGWRWTLILTGPVLWMVARRPFTAALLVIVGGW